MYGNKKLKIANVAKHSIELKEETKLIVTMGI